VAQPALISLHGITTEPKVVGDMVRLAVTFTSASSGQKVDPEIVRFRYLSPAEHTATTLVYDTDEELVRDSAGLYHTNLPLDEAGVWPIRWEADDDYVGATEFLITVAPSRF
jgi:hypothetical protein